MNTPDPLRIRVRSKQMTRTDVVNPDARIPFQERLIRAGAIDLKDNHREEVLPSGFVRVVAVDPDKKLSQPSNSKGAKSKKTIPKKGQQK